MNNLKLEIFNFKQTLTLDQEDVSRILENALINYDKYSEKELVISLNEKLEIYGYDKAVKGLLESLNLDMSNNSLTYDLKDLYKRIDRKNYGELYRHPLTVILTTINESDNDARMIRILNELAIYDWIPEVKHFMMKFAASPKEKQNLQNSGKIDNVYTLVEAVEAGHMVYVHDRWFLLGESKIQLAGLEDHVKDPIKLKKLRLMEDALKLASFSNDRVYFHIEEGLSIGLSTTDKSIFINEEKIEAETSVESIFASPIVPLLKRNYFPIVVEAMNNLDKFVELDVAKKVTNLTNSFCEAYAFNINGAMFLYDCDKRRGTSLFEYDSALEMVNDIRREFDADITFFIESNLSADLQKKRKLEDREREIKLKLDEINENIANLEINIQEMGGNAILEKALTALKAVKISTTTDLEKATLDITNHSKTLA